MYEYEGSIFLEEDDQCYSCKNYRQGTLCPLLEALQDNIVTLTEETQVNNCGFYMKSLYVIETKPTEAKDKNEEKECSNPHLQSLLNLQKEK